MTHVGSARCRACRATAGEVVLDLGAQPACDHFPAADDPGPDPTHSLRMWLCGACGLAQLLDDPTMPEEPRAAEPAALVHQAADAVDRLVVAGVLRPGERVVEYGSPHGGSWAGPLREHGLRPAAPDEPADVVLDCFGMMHCADQAAALADRAARVAPGGVLLLQYHSLATIVERGQWNSLRHGHFAYYSATALAALLSSVGFVPRRAWSFELYGGTVLLAATRESDGVAARAYGPEGISDLLGEERRLGLRDPAALRALQRAAAESTEALAEWLASRHAAGRRVLGYGAASRAVALLCAAGVTREVLPAVADASPPKQGRRMPGTDIPIVAPGELLAASPETVLLFLPDLLPEVRAALPGIETAGGEWVAVDDIGRSVYR